MGSESLSYTSQFWSLILDLCGHDHFIVCSILPWVVSSIFYWSLVAFFSFLDFTGIFAKYKIQPDKNRPINKKDFMRALSLSFLNEFVINFFVSLPFANTAEKRGISSGPILPSFLEGSLLFLGYIMFQEIWFYSSHRFLHIPFFYKHIHKVHHEWSSPFAAGSLYFHPVEHVLSNSLSVIIGPIILGGHIFPIILWILFILFVNTVDHSGYHLPFVYSNERHDFHHYSFVGNFANFGILDWFFGTDEHFLKSKQFQNHRVLFTSESAHERYDRIHGKDE